MVSPSTMSSMDALLPRRPPLVGSTRRGVRFALPRVPRPPRFDTDEERGSIRKLSWAIVAGIERVKLYHPYRQ